MKELGLGRICPRQMAIAKQMPRSLRNKLRAYPCKF
jgi:hypothetical protein